MLDRASRDVIEGQIAIHQLVAQADPLRAETIAAQQAPGGVVDATEQRLAGIATAIEVERQRPSLPRRPAQVDAQVALPPVVLVVRSERADARTFAQRVGGPREVEGIALASVGI